MHISRKLSRIQNLIKKSGLNKDEKEDYISSVKNLKKVISLSRIQKESDSYILLNGNTRISALFESALAYAGGSGLRNNDERNARIYNSCLEMRLIDTEGLKKLNVSKIYGWDVINFLCLTDADRRDFSRLVKFLYMYAAAKKKNTIPEEELREILHEVLYYFFPKSLIARKKHPCFRSNHRYFSCFFKRI